MRADRSDRERRNSKKRVTLYVCHSDEEVKVAEAGNSCPAHAQQMWMVPTNCA